MTIQKDNTNRQAVSDAVLDELMSGYEKPEDLLGEDGLFKGMHPPKTAGYFGLSLAAGYCR